jgi:N-methylhydantoinase B
MTIRHERIRFPPRGLLGGGNGAPGRDLLNGKVIAAKSRQQLLPGDIATFQTPGGGGLYPPAQRCKEAVAEDIRRGLLSEEKARKVHGGE